MSTSRTKLFISSVAQEELKRPRVELRNHLASLGHVPLLFEENFGNWSQFESTIQHCLNIVRQSDILVLLIAEKAGTYIKESDATVTYLEFHEAFKNRKPVIPFVKEPILNSFLKSILGIIKDAVTHFTETNNGRRPSSIYNEIVLPMQDSLPQHVDPFIWMFLYDLYQRGFYFEKYHESTDIIQKLDEVLSDMLRQGAKLLPLADELKRMPSIDHLENVDEFRDAFFSEMRFEPLTNESWQRLLPILLDKLSNKVKVSHERGEYFSEPIVDLLGCRAISLYKRIDDHMELVARTGNLGGKVMYFLDADKDTSYVVQAYLMEDNHNPRLWYREDKRTVYFVLRSGKFVLCMHYPLEKRLSREITEQHTDDFIRGIMEKQGDFISLVQFVLGGINR